MTDWSELVRPDRGEAAHSIRFVDEPETKEWLADQPESMRTFAAANRFTGKPGETLLLPADANGQWQALFGTGADQGFWDFASAAARLPEGAYRPEGNLREASLLGWLLAHYRFDRYRNAAEPVPQRILLTTAPAEIGEAVRTARAVALVRDLVNTPAEDMGPAALQHEAERLAAAHGGSVGIISGSRLEGECPMIHAVGRAADRSHAPRLIELVWGADHHPRIAIIGKGVTFDSGGLDIKPASGMKIMKKDMGGAAHALALAGLVMDARLPVRLHMIVPAAENAIAGNAFRPGDILRSRKGLTVEIDNTDAEGRLLLAEAISWAADHNPELIVDFATLTGAARVALGPDLPALFANDHGLAATIGDAGIAVHDPVWRLPLWSGYEDMLKSDIADTLNSGEGGLAGAITAALFLRKFVPEGVPWAHLDTWAWRASNKPGRPKGGEALGLRAVWAMLQKRYSTAG